MVTPVDSRAPSPGWSRARVPRVARRLASSALFLLLALTPEAHAIRCGEARPWVQVELDADTDTAWLATHRDDIVLELRAAMHRRGIAVCTPADLRDGAPRVYVLVLAANDAVRIVAGTTQGAAELERTLRLDDVPIDARAYTVAAVVDETLRSRWASLLPRSTPLDDQGEPIAADEAAAVAPPNTTRSASGSSDPARPEPEPPRAPVPDARERPIGVTVGARVRGFSARSGWIGGQLGVRARFVGHLELEVGLDGAAAWPTTLPLGDVRGEQLAGYLGARLTPMSWHEPIRFYGTLRLDGGAVWFRGDGPAGEIAAAASPNLNVEAGLSLTMVLVPEVELSLDGWLGGALVATYATDGVNRVSGVGELVGGGGLAVSFWP